MSKNDKDRVDARRLEFENLKEITDKMQEIIIDFEPGEIYFPAIYNPASFSEADKLPKWFGITVPATIILDELDDQTIKIKMGANIRPPVGACPFERIHLKSKLRPEVYTLNAEYDDDKHNNDPADLQSLQAKLMQLDARNKARDHLFINKYVRVHTKPYVYWSGEVALLRDNVDYMGVGMGLKKIGVWIDD